MTYLLERHQWSNNHIPAATTFLHNYGFKVMTAATSIDIEDCIDFIVEKNGRVYGIPFRLREAAYISYQDVTFRATNDRGNQSEWEKIRSGYGDYQLFAYSDGRNGFQRAILHDLNAMRATLDLSKFRPIPNTDGSAFIAIPFRLLTIIASTPSLEDYS